jgi:hypothetical protein
MKLARTRRRTRPTMPLYRGATSNASANPARREGIAGTSRGRRLPGNASTLPARFLAGHRFSCPMHAITHVDNTDGCLSSTPSDDVPSGTRGAGDRDVPPLSQALFPAGVPSGTDEVSRPRVGLKRISSSLQINHTAQCDVPARFSRFTKSTTSYNSGEDPVR